MIKMTGSCRCAAPAGTLRCRSPFRLPVPPTLAVGSDLKNTFAVGGGRYAWLSGHVGDMDDLATLRAFDTAVDHLETVTGVEPELLVADRHPGYRSGAWAAEHQHGRELVRVQHHHAHLAVGDGRERSPGRRAGDRLRLRRHGLRRRRRGVGRRVHDRDLRRLPAGRPPALRRRSPAETPASATRAGWRCRTSTRPASSGIQGLPSVAACTPVERAVLRRQLDTGLNTAPTSSMGRLFDAVSSLAGVCQRVAYEAEAAMRFEGLARSRDRPGRPSVRVRRR